MGIKSALFCFSIALILDSNCVKTLAVTKVVNEIKFVGVCGEIEGNKPETLIDKIFETSSSFHVKGRTTGKV